MLYVFLSPVQLWPHSNQTIKRLGYFLLFTKKMAFAASTAKILRGKKDKEGKKQSIAGPCQSPEDKVALCKQFHNFTSSYHHWLFLFWFYLSNTIKFSRTSVSGLEASWVWAQLENCHKCPQPRYLNKLSFIFHSHFSSFSCTQINANASSASSKFQQVINIYQ